MSREQFDSDIARVKRGLGLDEEGKSYSKERGLGPGLAAERLRERGVDVEGLLGSKVPTDMDYSKGGKVKTASSRADGCAKRGKTRGKMV